MSEAALTAREILTRETYNHPDAPRPPGMRVVTKGWWVLREEEKSLEEVRRLHQQDAEREAARRRRWSWLTSRMPEFRG